MNGATTLLTYHHQWLDDDVDVPFAKKEEKSPMIRRVPELVFHESSRLTALHERATRMRLRAEH